MAFGKKYGDPKVIMVREVALAVHEDSLNFKLALGKDIYLYDDKLTVFITKPEKIDIKNEIKRLFHIEKVEQSLYITINNQKLNMESKEINLENFIDVKGWKALGNRLLDSKILTVENISKVEDEKPEPVESNSEDLEDVSDINDSDE